MCPHGSGSLVCSRSSAYRKMTLTKENASREAAYLGQRCGSSGWAPDQPVGEFLRAPVAAVGIDPCHVIAKGHMQNRDHCNDGGDLQIGVDTPVGRTADGRKLLRRGRKRSDYRVGNSRRAVPLRNPYSNRSDVDAVLTGHPIRGSIRSRKGLPVERMKGV